MSEVQSTAASDHHTVGTSRVKRGMAEMLKGGVIMDVVTPDQAKIAELAITEFQPSPNIRDFCRQRLCRPDASRATGRTERRHRLPTKPSCQGHCRLGGSARRGRFERHHRRCSDRPTRFRPRHVRPILSCRGECSHPRAENDSAVAGRSHSFGRSHGLVGLNPTR